MTCRYYGMSLGFTVMSGSEKKKPKMLTAVAPNWRLQKNSTPQIGGRGGVLTEA